MAHWGSLSHASQLRHIVIHKASTRSKDNLSVTLRRLGDGVSSLVHLADYTSAGMPGQTRPSPMASSRPPHGRARALRGNRPTPSRLLTSLVSVFLLPILSLSLPCPSHTGPVPYPNIIHSLCRRSCLSLHPHCYHYTYKITICLALSARAHRAHC